MKTVKKIAAALVCVMLVGILAGCGAQFDAVAYMKANLDNSYKNDSTDLVKLKIGTAEEAAEVYKQGIDTEMSAFTQGVNISDELEQEFREVFEEIFSKVKYTVDKAEKQSDGSYVVTITYEKMQIFGPMVEDYINTVTVLAEDPAIQALSDSEQQEKVMEVLKDSLQKALDNVSYAEPAETTVTIEIVNRVYTPNSNDLYNLEMSFFDMESLNSLYSF